MTAINYNDGKWHGWNGGECPVHPETLVDARYICAGLTMDASKADHLTWEHGDTQLIAFRVINEHKEPREFWASQWKIIDSRSGEITSIGWEECSKDEDGAVLFREVIE